MPMNRPDKPLHSKGASSRDRPHDHPDRAADVGERASGAHAEQASDVGGVPPEGGPPAQGRGVPGPNVPNPDKPDREAADTRGGDRSGPASGEVDAASAQTSRADPAQRASAAGTGRSSYRGTIIAVVVVLILVGVILVAMVSGVFTVEG